MSWQDLEKTGLKAMMSPNHIQGRAGAETQLYWALSLDRFHDCEALVVKSRRYGIA
jgi:hypothetical protein